MIYRRAGYRKFLSEDQIVRRAEARHRLYASDYRRRQREKFAVAAFFLGIAAIISILLVGAFIR